MDIKESRKSRKEYLNANSHRLDTAKKQQRHIDMVVMEAGRTGFNRGLAIGFCIGCFLTAATEAVGLLILFHLVR